MQIGDNVHEIRVRLGVPVCADVPFERHASGGGPLGAAWRAAWQGMAGAALSAGARTRGRAVPWQATVARVLALLLVGVLVLGGGVLLRGAGRPSGDGFGAPVNALAPSATQAQGQPGGATPEGPPGRSETPGHTAHRVQAEGQGRASAAAASPAAPPIPVTPGAATAFPPDATPVVAAASVGAEAARGPIAAAPPVPRAPLAVAVRARPPAAPGDDARPGMGPAPPGEPPVPFAAPTARAARPVRGPTPPGPRAESEGSEADPASPPALVPSTVLARSRHPAGAETAPPPRHRASPRRRPASTVAREPTAPAAAAPATTDEGVATDVPVFNLPAGADTAWSRRRRSRDVLVAIRDHETIVVPDPAGPPTSVRVGQRLPSGARLLRVDLKAGAAETDRGLLRLE